MPSIADKFASTLYSIRIVVETALLSIWFTFTQIQSYLSRRTRSEPQLAGLQLRRKARPQQLDLSVCRRDSVRRYMISPHVCSPFNCKTPITGISYKDDPFLTVIPPPNNKEEPLSPQLADLSKTLEAQLGPLPDFWSMKLSTDKRIYFINTQSGETRWQDPRLAGDTKVETRPPPDYDSADNVPILNTGRSESAFTPIPPYSPSARIRISTWVEEERSKVRARNAKLRTLRSRVRMAKMQKYMQPLVL